MLANIRTMLKKKLFWGLLTVLLLALIFWLLSNNQGYVLIVRSPYRVQFSFNFLLFLMMIAFISLHYCLRFVRYLRLFPTLWRKNQAQKNLKESHTALIETVNALLNQDLNAAEMAINRAKYLHNNHTLDEISAAITQKNQTRQIKA